MLNKLRNRFIFINMLLVGVILIALFVGILAVNVVSNYNDLTEALEDALAYEIDIPAAFFIGDHDHGRPHDDLTRDVYVVSVSQVGPYSDSGYVVVKSVNNTVTMSDELLTSADDIWFKHDKHPLCRGLLTECVKHLEREVHQDG